MLLGHDNIKRITGLNENPINARRYAMLQSNMALLQVFEKICPVKNTNEKLNSTVNGN